MPHSDTNLRKPLHVGAWDPMSGLVIAQKNCVLKFENWSEICLDSSYRLSSKSFL